MCKSRFVTYLLKVRMRSGNILCSLKTGQHQLLWCQCPHNNLDDSVSAIGCWSLCRLRSKHQARYDIAHEPAKQRMDDGIEVDIGDDLLFGGSLQQRGDDRETALRNS